MLVSVIVPALNEEKDIRPAVDAARRDYSSAEVEIIVVDGGSADRTIERVPDHARVIQAPRGRAVQMNRGAAAASGEIYVFCHADSRLPEGWREGVLDALRQPDVSGGAFRSLFLPERGLILAFRNRFPFPVDWRWMYGDQAQFMRRDTFERVGGFPEIPLMEDVEMSRLLHREGRLVRLRLRTVTSSRRFLERGVLRQTLLNVWNMMRYLYLGATPQEIARSYRSSREEGVG